MAHRFYKQHTSMTKAGSMSSRRAMRIAVMMITVTMSSLRILFGIVDQRVASDTGVFRI